MVAPQNHFKQFAFANPLGFRASKICPNIPKKSWLKRFMPLFPTFNKNSFAYLSILLCLLISIMWLLNWAFWSFGTKNCEYSSFYKDTSYLHTKSHEIIRRNLDTSILQFYYYLSDQVHKNKNNTAFKKFGQRALDEYTSLMAQSSNFGPIADDAAQWHKEELQKMTDFIQEKLYKLQHPESCKETRILICVLSVDNCGLACLLHRVGHCLRYAAVTNRTMVLQNDKKWRYTKEGWNEIYEPYSNCSYGNIFNEDEESTEWESVDQTDRIVTLIYQTGELKRPKQIPLSFPKQIADALFLHHSNPGIWFGAQFYWYSIRINQKMRAIVDKFSRQINMNKGPIVGFQIRRSDKRTEASFFSVNAYFKWAELWFTIQERRNPGGPKLKRRVYIATDDMNAIKEAKRRFPHYEIQANFKAIKSAGVKKRYSNGAVYDIVTDYEILSKCDYVVCTFSSNICRLVHEIIQVERGDAESLVHSLDDTYYNYLQAQHSYTAIENHEATNEEEFSFKIGDVIGIKEGKGNRWNGYSEGFVGKIAHNGTHYAEYFSQYGLYPTYKVRERWNIVDFPLFEP